MPRNVGFPIRALPSGRFEARPHIDGRQLSRTFDTRAEAEDWIMRQRLAHREGRWVTPEAGKTTLGEWAWEWLDALAGKSPRTIAAYASVIRRLERTPLTRVTLADLRRIHVSRALTWMERRGYAENTRLLTYNTLHGMLDAAVADRLLAANPMQAMTPLRVQEQEMRFLTPAEVDRLSGALPERYATLPLFAASMGPRWQEAADLRVRHLDLLRGLARIPATKNHRRRHLPMPPSLVARMREHVVALGLRPDDPVWQAPRGGPLRADQFLRRAERAGKKASTVGPWPLALRAARLDPALRFHDLRHTCASWLVADGMDVNAVRKWLGHSSISTTERYVHLFPRGLDKLRDALEVVREASAEIGDGPASLGEVRDL